MKVLNELEKKVLAKFLDEENTANSYLRPQIEHIDVKSRRYTEVGFFSRFTLKDDQLRIPDRPRFILRGLAGDAKALRNGVGFVLYIDDGAISTLEGFTYDETWPIEIGDVILTR